MINIVTALSCEAKPVISRYRLKRQVQFDAFPCYASDQICLIVSGVGRIAMAAATAYLGACYSSSTAHDVWLNIGIAGHPDFDQGRSAMVHKVIDQATRKTWYPIFTSSLSITTASLLTCDSPVEDYSDNTLYDMEGSAFIETASRFSIFELIHIYKIVSDNKNSGIAHIDKNVVSQLVDSKLDDIDAVMNTLLAVKTDAVDTDREQAEYACFTQNVPFSFSQQQQLRRLLQRYYSLAPETKLDAAQYTHSMQPKLILRKLEQTIAELSLSKYLP